MKWPYGRDISMYVNNWWMPEHLRPLKCGLALILLISKVGINFLTLNLKFTFEEETHSFSKYPLNQCVCEQSSHAFDTSSTVISLSLSPKWPLKYSSHFNSLEKNISWSHGNYKEVVLMQNWFFCKSLVPGTWNSHSTPATHASVFFCTC